MLKFVCYFTGFCELNIRVGGRDFLSRQNFLNTAPGGSGVWEGTIKYALRWIIHISFSKECNKHFEKYKMLLFIFASIYTRNGASRIILLPIEQIGFNEKNKRSDRFNKAIWETGAC